MTFLYVCNPPCGYGTCEIRYNVTYCRCDTGWDPPLCVSPNQNFMAWDISHIVLLIFSLFNFSQACYVLIHLSNRSSNLRYLLWLAMLAPIFSCLHHILHYFTDHLGGMYSWEFILGSWFEGSFSMTVSALQITIYLYWLAITSEQAEEFIAFARPFGIIFIFIQAIAELINQIFITLMSIQILSSIDWYENQNLIELSMHLFFKSILLLVSFVLFSQLRHIKFVLNMKDPGGVAVEQKLLLGVRLKHWNMDWVNQKGMKAVDSCIDVEKDYVLVRKVRESVAQSRDNHLMRLLSLATFFVTLFIILNFMLIVLTITDISAYKIRSTPSYKWMNFLLPTGRRFMSEVVVILIVQLIHITNARSRSATLSTNSVDYSSEYSTRSISFSR